MILNTKSDNINERGSILVVTLWALLFLSLLAVVSGSVVRQEIMAVEKLEARTRLYDLSYSGVMAAIDCVNFNRTHGSGAGKDVAALNDIYFNNEAFFKEHKMPGGVFIVRSTRSDNITGAKITSYGVIDEERKININYAPREVLENVFLNIAGLEAARAQQLANAIIDWRDADDLLGTGGEGLSEAVDYANSGYEYGPKNLSFRSMEEVLLVKGVTTEIFYKVKDYITVYGSGKVNINTASREVLFALGLDRDVIEKIILFRAGPDMREGTPDDNPFTSTKSLSDTLAQTMPVTRSDRESVSKLLIKNIADVNSTTFSVVSTAQLEGTGLTGKAACVFNADGTIEYWGYR